VAVSKNVSGVHGMQKEVSKYAWKFGKNRCNGWWDLEGCITDEKM
jgi:hypothetical protein